MSTVNERVALLREKMKAGGYAGCYVTTNDFHLSEYVGAHFKARAYLSGFTGSAGTLVILRDKAGLWTDGRYFLQAARELEGSPVELFRMGEKGVPTVYEFLESELGRGDVLATDGRTVSVSDGKKIKASLERRGARLDPAPDLPGEVWPERPPIASSRAWILEEKYAGRSAADKLREVREKMDGLGAEIHLIAALDEIVWLFNLRGDDVPSSPVLLSYAAVEKDRAILFIDENKIPPEVGEYLSALGVELAPYDGVYEYAAGLARRRVLVSEGMVNYALYSRLMEGGADIVTADDPVQLMKAVKNEREIENIRRCHVLDGVAVTRFMRWVKENAGKTPVTEISAAEYLEKLRRAIPGNLGLSFGTICGYGPHGAVIHYHSTPDTDVPLERKGLLLVDSGGQYYTGTTDITRTFALGELTEEEKRHFALVLKSHLDLEYCRFPEGATGAQIDIVARRPVWDEMLDFKHGTGHGVGYLINVHEGPNRIFWKAAGSAVMQPGMITTDEPGIYIEGSHGIRLENELLCVELGENEYGKFLGFEPVTYAPIDLDAVDVKYLNETDRRRLNDYHRLVYEKLSPELLPDEREWLARYTREI